jgi:putative endonuclease
MFYVYIIESETTLNWYYGFTERPVERLKEHNSNNHHYTANKGPWELVFLRIFESKAEAIAFEKKLKLLRNKDFIKREYGEYFLKG